MGLVAKPMQPVGTTPSITSLPQMPGISGAASPSDPAISTNTIRQRPGQLTVALQGTAWMAQCRSGDYALCYYGKHPLTGGNYSYFFCNPTLVDYASVTRTGRQPRYNLNSYGGWWNPYTENIANAYVVGSGGLAFPTWQQFIYEDRVRVLTAAGAITINKIPTLVDAGDTGFLVDTHLEEVVTTLSFYDATFMGGILSAWGSLRYSGGNVGVSFGNDTTGFGWNVFVGKIDPGTMQATVFTIVATGMGNTTATISEATLLTAGISRWDHVFFTVDYVSSGAPPPPEPITNYLPGDSVDVSLYATLDVPPWYDMPGVDGMIPGGYLT